MSIASLGASLYAAENREYRRRLLLTNISGQFASYIDLHCRGVYPYARRSDNKPPVLLPVIKSTESRKEGCSWTMRCKIVLLKIPLTPPPSRAKTRNFLWDGGTSTGSQVDLVQNCLLESTGGGRWCSCSGAGARDAEAVSDVDGVELDVVFRRWRSCHRLLHFQANVSCEKSNGAFGRECTLMVLYWPWVRNL